MIMFEILYIIVCVIIAIGSVLLVCELTPRLLLEQGYFLVIIYGSPFIMGLPVALFVFVTVNTGLAPQGVCDFFINVCPV